jgi:hypothetical protein
MSTCVETETPAARPDPRTPSYLEAVKILGTGNSTGFFGALVALYYFRQVWPDASIWIMMTACFYLAGICLFAVTFQLLTIFSIQQANGSTDQAGIERLRKWLVGVGVGSLVAWWIGTISTIGVLIVMYCTKPD